MRRCDTAEHVKLGLRSGRRVIGRNRDATFNDFPPPNHVETYSDDWGMKLLETVTSCTLPFCRCLHGSTQADNGFVARRVLLQY